MHRATIPNPAPARPIGLILAGPGRPDPEALARQGRHPAFLLLDDRPGRREAVTATLRAWLAQGLDPALTTVCLRSGLPALAELSRLCLEFVTLARLEQHRPAAEALRACGFARDIPAGLLAAPADAAGAIAGFRATRTAAGPGEGALIEQANEILRHLNAAAGAELLSPVRARPLAAPPEVPVPRLTLPDPRPDELRDILRDGTLHARRVTEETRAELASALGLFQL